MRSYGGHSGSRIDTLLIGIFVGGVQYPESCRGWKSSSTQGKMRAVRSHNGRPYRKEITMAGSGSKDKGNKEQKKKPKHNLKEKRKLKQEKKQKTPFAPG